VTLKHYTVEANRGHDNVNISKYDMADSYLRQYEMVPRGRPQRQVIIQFTTANEFEQAALFDLNCEL